MRRLVYKVLVCGVMVLGCLGAFAQAPLVRAHLEPAGKITVGQPVRLIVSVFVPNYFTGGVDLPELEMEDAIVVLPQDRPEHANMQLNGVSYAGITQTYVIYPQQAGDFRVPPAKFRVPYAAAPPKSVTAELSLPTLSFHAEVPAIARNLPYFLPTEQLTITQRWSRPLKGLRTGDSVERTITVTAAKMQSMLIPPLELKPPDGIRVYPGEPITHDHKTDRGDFVYGQRVETVKYLVDKPGDYALPAVELKWWNLATQRLMTSALPTTKFSVAANSEYTPELLPPPDAPAVVPVARVNYWHHYRRTVYLSLALLAGLICLLFLSRWWRRLWLALREWRRERELSEHAIFRRLIRFANADDAERTYVCLLGWLKSEPSKISLRQPLTASALDPAQGEIDRLTSYLYAPRSGDSERSSWSGKELAGLLKESRRRLLIRNERSFRVLPPLNP
jgi:BatD DUF11 like domain